MLLMTIAFYIALFSTINTYGIYIQLFVLGVFVVEAMRCLVYGSLKSRSANMPVTIFVLTCVLPLFAAIVALVRQNYESAAFGMVSIVALLAVYHCLQYHGMSKVIKAFFLALAFGLGTVILLEYDSLIVALALTNAEIGVARFAPFESHPNLIGHIFGALTCVSICLFHAVDKYSKKLIYTVCFVCSITLVLAASSRGGLFALAGAIVLAMLFEGTHINNSMRSKYKFFIPLFIIIALLMLNESMRAYFIELLQLDNNERGVNSGLTGRVDAWPKVIDIVTQEISSLLFGFGYRSWDNLVRGFEIDNSYVNLFYETGIISTLATVIIILYSLYKTKEIICSLERQLCRMLIFFVLLEGVVIRYMIAIGNPASLFFLFVLFYSLTPRVKSRSVNDGLKLI